MEKKNEIGKNTSSGAEKVQEIAKEKKTKSTTGGKKTATKKTTQKTTAVKSPVQKKVEKENMNAEKRVQKALKKNEAKAELKAEKQKAKEKRKEKKLNMKAEKQKRIAERKAKRLENQRLAKAKREERRAKENEKRLELKLQRREAKIERANKKLESRNKRRERRTPGIGGWLAAVITLGSVSLVLGTVATYEAVELNRSNGVIGAGYRSGIYELTSIVDTVDNDFSKVRISEDKERQTMLLTDILVETKLAESTLSKLPIKNEDDANVSTFINRTSDTAERLLYKLSEGGTLTDKDKEEIENLYTITHKVRQVLDEMAVNMKDKTIYSLMKEKVNEIGNGFRNMEDITLDGGNFLAPTFEENAENKENGIPSALAEKKCREYFNDYKIKDVKFAGETTSNTLHTYNFELKDESGRDYFAEISTDNGELVSFDSFVDCKEKNFDLENSKTIAEEFLKDLGYDDMQAVWVSENGNQVIFNYVYSSNGWTYYSDSVKVKVCEEKGKVVGFDATKHILNGKDHIYATANITESEAENKLNSDLTVKTVRKAVIPVGGREVATYEFITDFEGEEYFVYIDAKTGKEAEILCVENSAQGRILK